MPDPAHSHLTPGRDRTALPHPLCHHLAESSLQPFDSKRTVQELLGYKDVKTAIFEKCYHIVYTYISADQ